MWHWRGRSGRLVFLVGSAAAVLFVGRVQVLAPPDARWFASDIRLPLVSQEIDVSVADLINRKYLR